MTRLKISLANNTCECSCNMCDSKFTLGNLTERGKQEFREAIMTNGHYCFNCKKYLAGISNQQKEAIQGNEKALRDLWNKLRCFRVITTHIPTLDDELKERFGDWKDYETKSIYGT